MHFQPRIDEVAWTECQLRVAYRLVQYDFKYNPNVYSNPAEGLADLARRVSAGGFGTLATFLLAAAVARQQRNMTYVRWHTEAIRRARAGYTFRRVAYGEYKASRRDDPRVTNRGVTETALSASGSEVFHVEHTQEELWND